MIKECKVLNYNQYQNILVADFDGIQVQFPCKERVEKFCYIKKDKDIYTLSTESEFKKENIKKEGKYKRKSIDKKDESDAVL